MQNNISQQIKNRISVRTYETTPIEESKHQKLLEFATSNSTGPFGNKIRFEFLQIDLENSDELKSLGTYGMIKGAKLYLAGVVKNSPLAMEDFGYCMEGMILKATSLDLGTCWLGGTFKRSSFAKKLHLADDEILPCISPVGVPLTKTPFKEKMIRKLVNAANRKPFESIFYEGVLGNPISRAKLGEYETVLENCRIAPSASNKQPWRVIRDANKFHLYLDKDKLYNSIFKEIAIQYIDMGIFMYHFEKSALQFSLQGSWLKEEPQITHGDLTYIVSWVCR